MFKHYLYYWCPFYHSVLFIQVVDVHDFWYQTEPFAATGHSVGHKFHEVFQVKPGRYADLPAAKISEMMKSNSLDVNY